MRTMQFRTLETQMLCESDSPRDLRTAVGIFENMFRRARQVYGSNHPFTETLQQKLAHSSFLLALAEREEPGA